MFKNPVYITALGSISALGHTASQIKEAYKEEHHYLSEIPFNTTSVWGAKLNKTSALEIQKLKESDSKYKSLDNSVLYALFAARNAFKASGWDAAADFGINIGSSRGATALFEGYHKEFLKDGKTATLASPTTTLGNISSWIAHDLGTKGPTISHSITCSTALHAMLNGIVWLQSGMAEKFMVGGSEAPLTPFTIAQMKALKVYSKESGVYPCRAMDLKKETNTMVLGEGAAVACLETGNPKNYRAKILGIGYATERLKHNVSISSDAQCFQDAMQMALQNAELSSVDAIVMHAPGTIKGDTSEYNAIHKVFGENRPFLTTNKWKIGHTFGASGMLSLELGLLLLEQQQGISSPFYQNINKESFKSVLINAVGFGGNAVSVILSK
ncbi:beta-ketoacyl synthase N-terminal-like domain-containing protein [Croceivirga sp. JEA036]|uniref:beta-ketoacyl synthase N-terminal-like domain-containing protein n=1 Tax=Croceivirga sp. JEA036 TaxID=2721162 RepID=UPI00143C79D4|nr:beta-ketoacyl synthase N-terminal-like domain-containing protein [Croceivirga sp. JEA036]NJB36847.1 beta-ketoacyl synthase [Croceivirga sp. JEA036]